MASAEHLFATMIASPSAMRPLALQQAQVEIAVALAKIFQIAQDEERQRLADDPVGTVWLAHSLSPHIDEAVGIVQEAVKGTKYEEHFNRDEVVLLIKQVVGQHFVDINHIERLWYVDRNPQLAAIQDYKKRTLGQMPREAGE